MTARPRLSSSSLLVWLAISVAPALTEVPPDAWYRQLAKPDWSLPGDLFGPVWTPLCVLLGIAIDRVARRDGPHSPAGLAWFFVQLVLSALWTPLFFGLHRPDLALVCIVALWLSIIGTMRAFARVDAASSAMLTPYLLWVGFTAAVNATIWDLNR